MSTVQQHIVTNHAHLLPRPVRPVGGPIPAGTAAAKRKRLSPQEITEVFGSPPPDERVDFYPSAIPAITIAPEEPSTLQEIVALDTDIHQMDELGVIDSGRPPDLDQGLAEPQNFSCDIELVHEKEEPEDKVFDSVTGSSETKAP